MAATTTTTSTSTNTTTATCSITDFIFFDSAGNPVLGDYNDDGICVFEAANCHPKSLPSECCTYDANNIRSNERSNAKNNNDNIDGWISKYMMLCLLVPICYMKKVVNKKAVTNDHDDEEDEDQYEDQTNNTSSQEEQEQEQEEKKETVTPYWWSIIEYVYSKGFLVFMLMSIGASIATRKSYQTTMSVSHRTLLMSTEAFMVPFYEIFQFIEDIVLVQIGHALGRKDRKLTDHLIHAGIAGSVVTGILAGAIGTLLGLLPNVFGALTNPGLKNDQSIYEGCEFFDSSQDEISAILPYWMMKSWVMIFQQIGMVLSGFFFAAKAITGTYLFIY